MHATRLTSVLSTMADFCASDPIREIPGLKIQAQFSNPIWRIPGFFLDEMNAS
jgi:hypothetical protein